MISLIVLYFAIGLLLGTNIGWNELIRLREEEHFSKPLIVVVVIVSSFIVPIAFVVGLFQGVIERLRNN